MKNRLHHTIRYVEDKLQYYYKTNFSFSAVDLLLDDKVSTNQTYIQNSEQAQVIIEQLKGSNEVFIGLYLPQLLKDSLEDQLPEKILSFKNLNNFCTLVEEISHLHLIAYKIQQEQLTQKRELEFQAEIDKFLITSLTLKQQTGNYHSKALTQHLFYNFKWSDNSDHYLEANQAAFNFLSSLPNNLDLNKDSMKYLFRSFFRLSWHNKKRLIADEHNSLKNIA